MADALAAGAQARRIQRPRRDDGLLLRRPCTRSSARSASATPPASPATARRCSTTSRSSTASRAGLHHLGRPGPPRAAPAGAGSLPRRARTHEERRGAHLPRHTARLHDARSTKAYDQEDARLLDERALAILDGLRGAPLRKASWPLVRLRAEPYPRHGGGEVCRRRPSASMAGLGPAIHVLLRGKRRRGCPRQASEATPSFGRLCAGMTAERSVRESPRALVQFLATAKLSNSHAKSCPPARSAPRIGARVSAVVRRVHLRPSKAEGPGAPMALKYFLARLWRRARPLGEGNGGRSKNRNPISTNKHGFLPSLALSLILSPILPLLSTEHAERHHAEADAGLPLPARRKPKLVRPQIQRSDGPRREEVSDARSGA